jgi:hypothetical protein
MVTARKRRDGDIRLNFDRLSDDVLIDDGQFADVADVAPSTVKRWRREGKTPPVVMLNGRPRHRVGNVRPWLRGRVNPLV